VVSSPVSPVDGSGMSTSAVTIGPDGLGKTSTWRTWVDVADVKTTWTPSDVVVGADAVNPEPSAGVTVRLLTAPVVGSTAKLRLPTPGSVTVKVPADEVTVGPLAGAVAGGGVSAPARATGPEAAPNPSRAADEMKAMRRMDMRVTPWSLPVSVDRISELSPAPSAPGCPCHNLQR
jgi:hypothetical protein